ncbi:hypothetical protein L9F63_025397, partial [Diploptera punctata]
MALFPFLLLLCLHVLTCYGEVKKSPELLAAKDVATKYIFRPEVMKLVKKLDEEVTKARNTLQKNSTLLYDHRTNKENEFNGGLQNWIFTLITASPQRINDFKSFLSVLENEKFNKQVLRHEELKDVEQTFSLPPDPTDKESKRF